MTASLIVVLAKIIDKFTVYRIRILALIKNVLFVHIIRGRKRILRVTFWSFVVSLNLLKSREFIAGKLDY